MKLATDAPQTLTLAAKQRNRVSRAAHRVDGAGASRIDVQVAGPDGFALKRSYALDVRPANQILTRRTVKRLAPGETLTL